MITQDSDLVPQLPLVDGSSELPTEPQNVNLQELPHLNDKGFSHQELNQLQANKEEAAENDELSQLQLNEQDQQNLDQQEHSQWTAPDTESDQWSSNEQSLILRNNEVSTPPHFIQCSYIPGNI